MRWLCIFLTTSIYLFNKYSLSTCSVRGNMVEIGEREGKQIWALPQRLILAINPQGHHHFHDFWVPGYFTVSPGTLLEAMPRPGCFRMPLNHGSAKAGGNRAKRSWILNKPGFLSNIVERPLSVLFFSNQIRKSQSRWGHWELWCTMSFRKWIFFFFFRRRRKKETEKTNLSGNYLWILAVEKAAWGQSSRVTLSMSFNISGLHLRTTQGQQIGTKISTHIRFYLILRTFVQ